MIDYNQLYLQALAAYTQKKQRAPITLINQQRPLIYRYEWFERLLHSHCEYSAIHFLRCRLQREISESAQRLEIKIHFMNPSGGWSTHSFNNYLLDEIRKSTTEEEWNKHWKHYDKKPLFFHKGLIYKTTNIPPNKVFINGIFEKQTSEYIDDYIVDSNDKVGVSTNRLFFIARNEALQTSWFNQFFSPKTPSYIYIIDYQDNDAICLTPTLDVQGRTFAAMKPRAKEEVNLLNGVAGEHIIGAFKVSHNPHSINWVPNDCYHGNAQFMDQLPANFKDIIKKYNNSLYKNPSPSSTSQTALPKS